ncbi:XdhC family protein [Kitasatospora sp. DSM 101779]|uniref:XdhC family protein n=1 Tax=Kitasatospora sp. DSM 101779 TaxID=2853165 RepID=UPI0021DB2F0E|nr:XdhC/CoxI family protein [Kitasatospora sp. DSM 101779]MCU7821176.1 XdhC family protein [Kitasatospora sp. DSM 101779]
MLDIAAELHRWCAEGRDFAVATVVHVSGSAPRPPGTALAVDAGGTAVGSVSGGCVEATVYQLCQEALETGDPVLQHFGHADEDPFAVGLTCGGTIDVLVTPVRRRDAVRPLLAAALDTAAGGGAVAVARVAEGPDGLPGGAMLVRPGGVYEGTLGGGTALDAVAALEAAALLAAGRTLAVEVAADCSDGSRPVLLLVESSVPPPRMIVFGAIDFASALVRIGRFLGHHVTVCDARAVFATRERFAEADEVVVDHPHRYLDSQLDRIDGRTVLCALTHDARFDVPLLTRALRLPVAYVGAMGSRRTHDDRLERLRAAGLSEAELARLRSPIGLDLGAWTPEEVAVSIAAELVACRNGGTGLPLGRVGAPIHRAPSRTGRPVAAR